MKKHLLLFLTIILSLSSYSQITFNNGYYINNANQKINCQIKNIDWKNNPTEFEYRLSENSDYQTASITTVKEFSINDDIKYIRAKVDIDRSSSKLEKLSNNKRPSFKEEELFLKVLVEGEYILYQYVDNNLSRYFYSKNNSDIEQLIYKSYKSDYNKVNTNNRFRQQLYNDLKCPSFELNDIENLKYKKQSLVNFFIKYNTCNNLEYKVFDQSEKDMFNLNIRPQLRNTSLAFQHDNTDNKDTDFGSKTGFAIGLEAEFILPYNKNKWAIIVEPTYQNFNVEKTSNVREVSGGILITSIKYSSIEIPLGLRHYFFLNNDSKIFLNASYVIDLGTNSIIEFERKDGSKLSPLEIETRPNAAFGLGYKHNDKYSLEIRYQTNRQFFGNDLSWTSDYKSLAVIFGYTIF